MRHRSMLLPVVGILLAGSACVRRPEKVRSDSDMVPVLADLELAGAYGRAVPGSGVDRDGVTDYVIGSHGLTREEFDSTMAWYGRNPDVYFELCDKIDRELSMRKRRLAGGVVSDADSPDLWTYSRMAVITQGSASDGMEFSITTADVEPGQRLRWRMRLSAGSGHTELIGVEYDDGTKGYRASSGRGNNVEVTFQTDTARSVTRIFGNMQIEREARRPLWADSIALTSLPFDSMEYHTLYSQRLYREPAPKPKPKPIPENR